VELLLLLSCMLVWAEAPMAAEASRISKLFFMDL
jgi:hypothetical protein